MKKTKQRAWVVGIIAIIVSVVVFLVPFSFVIIQAAKSPAEASDFSYALPSKWQFVENLLETLAASDGILVRGLINSAILTVGSVTLMVIISAMAGYVLARKNSRLSPVVNFFVLAGLIVPPAVVPTIWVMQRLQLYGTMFGMILIEATFGLSFCILLFRAFVSNIPRELDEAAVLDGAGPIRLFAQVVLPLLRPAIVTVIVVQSVFIFNDFALPLYILPGAKNVTSQLALFTFYGQNLSFYNLLFMAIFLITIPPLIGFIFFNRQIIGGLTDGAVKG